MPVIDETRPVTGIETKTERPPLYKVLLLNDDYTPFELVLMALMKVFGMGREKAVHVMMEAHRKGSSLVAAYAKDVAETKVKEAEDFAREYGAALKFSVEKE